LTVKKSFGILSQIRLAIAAGQGDTMYIGNGGIADYAVIIGNKK